MLVAACTVPMPAVSMFAVVSFSSRGFSMWAKPWWCMKRLRSQMLPGTYLLMIDAVDQHQGIVRHGLDLSLILKAELLMTTLAPPKKVSADRAFLLILCGVVGSWNLPEQSTTISTP